MRIADGSKRHGKQLVDTTNACTPTLTTKQQRLVQDNIGLVAVHLKRHVSNLAQPRRDREWDDLFQEGCLGLIEAARRFRKQLGIPFAAFALPRIHNAISKALYTKFSTVYVPPPRADRQRPDIPTDSTDCERFLPKVISMSDEQTERLADRRGPDVPPTTRETIGQRLQEKYERAVRMAQKELSAKASIRGDRDELVRILTEERLLIPQEESRRALRQIARDTHSSYARVAQCDFEFRTFGGQEIAYSGG